LSILTICPHMYKKLGYGSPAAGATPHFVGTMLGKAAGLQLNHIPFKGGAKHSRFLPNVPTFAESGFKDVVAKLNAAIQKALKAKPLIEGLEKPSFEVEGQSSAEFNKIVKGELDRWGPVVNASGFSSED
jgi:tripartite-type tricarboxylate transporter receptor subunit TctC